MKFRYYDKLIILKSPSHIINPQKRQPMESTFVLVYVRNSLVSNTVVKKTQTT